ncbi:MAG: class F sortase [Candidatus Dormibacteria bacterium]
MQGTRNRLVAGVLAVALVLLGLGSAALLHSRGGSPATASRPSPSPRAVAPSASATVSPPAAPSGSPLEPNRLLIAKLGVDAPVDPVGVDTKGNMDIPPAGHWFDVAWYAPGVLPGHPGDAVIDGHLDSTTGPAVFWHLADLNPGDTIVVILKDGTHVSYKVTLNKLIQPTAPPKDLFSSKGAPRLTLITCAGTFDKARREYSERRIVDATLVT